MAKRSLKALSLIMVCGMLLTGCGGSTTASTTTAAADSSAAAAETAASTDSGTHFIGLAMHNQTRHGRFSTRRPSRKKQMLPV